MNKSHAYIAALLGTLVLGSTQLACAQSTKLPWNATFDAGGFGEWTGFNNGTGITIQTTGCRSGRCARAPLVAADVNNNYGDFTFGDHAGVGGPKVEEVWARFYSKFDQGYVWPNRSQKLAIFNVTNGQSWERLFQIYVYVRPNGQYAVDKSNLSTWQFFGLYQNRGTPVSVRFGQWDKVKVYARLNTPGASDGIVRLWINDELKAEYTDVNIRENTSYGWGRFNLSSYSTQGGGSAGVQWWDQFTVSTTDPDGSVVKPQPPTNVRAE